MTELEARTNDRLRDERGDIALVRPADRIVGPGITPIMAAFTHARPSRFTDGSYGISYAAQYRESAIFETVFHLELFYGDTMEESADVDMRVYAARIAGAFDDLLALAPSDPRLDPSSYNAARAYARTRSPSPCVCCLFSPAYHQRMPRAQLPHVSVGRHATTHHERLRSRFTHPLLILRAHDGGSSKDARNPAMRTVRDDICQ